jgi:aspartyl aminopeptidase
MASLQKLTPGLQAKGLVDFINQSPSPFHAVNTVKQRLLSNGFRELKGSDPWTLNVNDRVFLTHNHSTIYAITIGGQYQPGNGFTMIGAHTDSPCLRVKPNSDRCKEGYRQVGVQTYGGGLWYSWFDRDLTVAGRVFVRTNSESIEQRLIHIQRPICRVSSLAIHLNRQVNENFSPNAEQHLVPILATCIEEDLFLKQAPPPINMDSGSSCGGAHPRSLIFTMAQELTCQVDDILEMELCLADTQPAAIGGLCDEFVFAPRLDNLFNCYAAVEGLISSLDTLNEDTNIRIACLYDHEEVGSQSAQGAGSAITRNLLHRLIVSFRRSLAENGDARRGELDDALERAIDQSYMLSADQAHAVHPNYDEKHERNHRPQFQRGIVLKTNANQRYASNSLSSLVIKEIARTTDVPVQEFVVRQDIPCGSTIGPILSAGLGMLTMDVGGPMLSMHSCREMCDVASVGQAVQLFTAFYTQLPNVLKRVKIG